MTQQSWLDKLKRFLNNLANNQTDQQAKIKGSGTIVQGTDHTVATTGGLVVKQTFQIFAPQNYSEMRENYLNYLFNSSNRLSLSGIDRQAAGEATYQLELNQVYTGLYTTASEQAKIEREMMPDREARQIPALEQLNKHGRLVLLGDPGSGKSAFVNFVALCLAGELLGKPEANIETLVTPLPVEDEEKEKDKKPQPQPWHQGNLFPVVVILRDLAAGDFLPPAGQRANASHLQKFVFAELRKLSLDGYAEEFWKEFTQKGLLLLDGLDEIPAADKRRLQIKQMVQNFADAYGKVRILVTSRTYAYQKEDWRLEKFNEAVLAPFGPGQIKAFVQKWYEYVGAAKGISVEHSQGRGVLLNEAIQRNERLRDFAKRPLLLTLMASLHAWRNGTLPDDRQELYEQSVDLLLEWWQKQKSRVNSQGQLVVEQPNLNELLGVTVKEVREVLNRLAYQAHANQAEGEGEKTADIPTKDLLSDLQELTKNRLLNKDIEDCIRERTGLLIPKGGKVYTFPHRTFQEYLSACYLTDDEFPDKIAELAKKEPQRWREVVLLAGAKASVGVADAVWNLAEALCEADQLSDNSQALWGAQLAGQLLAEVVKSDKLEKLTPRHKPKLARVKKWLVHILQGGQLSVLERANAGVSLAKLGDERPEVMTVEGMEFCYVPSGPFWMGSDDGEKNEKPCHIVDLPYSYYIGRLPVTNAQYDQFIQSGGYKNPAYWQKAKRDKLWSEDGFCGYFDKAPRQKPYDYGFPYSLPNHPIVGISWHEALAFTYWLTQVWEDNNLQEWIVRLPTEAEWEKAYRGGINIPSSYIFSNRANLNDPLNHNISLEINEFPKRLYVWRGKLVKSYANFNGSGVGSTMACGAFVNVNSPYGLQELTGQVWEWTQSMYSPYPYNVNDGREDLDNMSLSVGVCMRGGSWEHSEHAFRSSYRYRDYSYHRSEDCGFRIVISRK